MINWSDPKNNWMQPAVRKDIAAFQDQQVEAEFAQAVEEHRVEEVYWVGGEPLMYEQHWRYMNRIVELGDGPRVYARYNTNLSRTSYRGIDLFDNIINNLRDWQICASLDGTGPIGEYIRTGLNYDSWRKNYDRAVTASTHRRQTRIDFTLTLPGMFEVGNIVRLAQETNTDILAKVVFAFTPDIVMSPMALPRHLLDPWIDELITTCSGAMQDVLMQLKTRPTFEEQWPDTWKQGIANGKRRVLKLEQIREDKFTMADILAGRSEILKWWNQIDC